MGSMFHLAELFNQDIGNWYTPSVTNMGSMFGRASQFNQDISRWDTSSVSNMDHMFGDAVMFNQDISEWDVSNVTSMQILFHAARSFNQDLSDWNISSVTDMYLMFDLTDNLSDTNKGLIHSTFSTNSNWPYDWSAFAPNNPPSNLTSVALLSIAENQPIGTVVGEFNATDPDAGATLSYSLVSGVGDISNSFFTLESNGTLRPL